MRFVLIDKVVSLERGKEIRTVKSVSLAEEYLADHFPTFPVLPGVFLLQGLIESASWLVRATQDFAHSMVQLEQAKNVRYRSFLAPGSQIEYRVEAKMIEQSVSSFSGYGVCGDNRVIEARFGLRHFNLSDDGPAWASADARVNESMKMRWRLICPRDEG